MSDNQTTKHPDRQPPRPAYSGKRLHPVDAEQITAAERLRKEDREIEAGGTDVNFWPSADIRAVLDENDQMRGLLTECLGTLPGDTTSLDRRIRKVLYNV